MADPHRWRGDAPHFFTVDDVLALCATRIRRELLAVLSRGPQDVTTIAQTLGLGVGSVSEYLHSLETAGFVVQTKRGQRHVYRLGPRVRVKRPGGWMTTVLRADDNSIVTIALPPDVARQFERRG